MIGRTQLIFVKKKAVEKPRQAKEILAAFQKCEEKLVINTQRPQLYIFDSEALNELKNSFLRNNQNFELIPHN